MSTTARCAEPSDWSNCPAAWVDLRPQPSRSIIWHADDLFSPRHPVGCRPPSRSPVPAAPGRHLLERDEQSWRGLELLHERRPRVHAASEVVGGEKVLTHQLLSERRFFAEFLGLPEPSADQVLPMPITIEACVARLEQLAARRLPLLAQQAIDWWSTEVQFFDVRRERSWVFWRRVLHTAHHRTQLTVYLHLLDRAVPATYGPTADVTWSGADPTLTVASASRGGREGNLGD